MFHKHNLIVETGIRNKPENLLGTSMRLQFIGNNNYLVLIISLILLHCYSVKGQEALIEKYNVRQYTDDNGLPQNSIKSISGDAHGFVWLATEDGLARFDGRQFYTFNKANLSTSSNHYFLIQPSLDSKNSSGKKTNHSIFAVADGNEYVRIEDGIAVRDSAYYVDKVKPFLFLKDKNHQTFQSSKLPDYLLGMANPKHWIIPAGYGKGNFYLCDSTSIQYYSEGKEKYKTKFQKDNGWNFFVNEGKLYYFNKDGLVIHINDKKRIRFSLSGDILNHPAYKKEGSNKITLFWNNASDQLFFYLGNDLFTLDRFENGQVYTRLLLKNFDLDSRYIQSIHFDKKSKTLFLGSITKGLFIISGEKFQNLTTPGDEMNNVFYAQIAYDRNSVLTSTGILLGKDPKEDKIIFNQLPVLGKLNKEDKRSLLRDKNGFIWVKSGGDLVKMDAKAEKVIMQWHLTEEIKDIYQGNGDLILFGTANKGLYYIDPRDAKPEPKIYIKNIKVTFLLFQSKDHLLVGTTNGLYSIDLISGKLKIIQGTKGLYIKTIYVHKPDQILLTTEEKGMMLYTKSKLVTFPMDANRYLTSSHCIINDGNGFYWITSNKGLFQVSIKDTERYARLKTSKNKNSGEAGYPELFYNYYAKDEGFLTNEFNGGCQPCAVKLANGYISLPSLNGLVWFLPGNIKADVPDGPIILDRVELNNKNQTLLSDTLQLPANPAQTKFYFSTPYYGNTYNLHLSYALIKTNKNVTPEDWIPLKSENLSITLTYLTSGKYSLLVRKMNGFGINNYTIKKIILIVPPLWYETWWSKALLAILLIVGIYVYNEMRLRQILKKNHLLESKVSQRTSELNLTLKDLKVSHNDLEISKNQISRQLYMMSRLLTSVTHDIQSPLKYITHTSEAIPVLIKRGEFDRATEISELIMSSSLGMHSRLKDLLDYIKTYVYGKSMKFENIDLKALVADKINIFKSVNEEKNNIISIDIPEHVTICSDYQMLSIILQNIMDNATKYTKNGEISIYTEQKDMKVHLVISNNGIPLSDELVQTFNGYTASSQSFTNGIKTGLGLLIIMEIAVLINVGVSVAQTKTTDFRIILNEN